MTPEKQAALDAELRTLNQDAAAALLKRKQWMDAHMKDYAEIQAGEQIYDSEKGLLGVVTEHYRYWDNKDPRYDTSMSIDYCYSAPNGTIDNTSRQPGIFPISKAAYIRYQEYLLQNLKETK